MVTDWASSSTESRVSGLRWVAAQSARDGDEARAALTADASNDAS